MDSKPANSLSEKELVRLVGDGDPRGQRELYVRYAGMMTAVASRYLSDSDTVKDVLQDAFIRIFEKFDSFRYRGEGSLRAWMSRVVANGALQVLRKQGRLLQRCICVDIRYVLLMMDKFGGAGYLLDEMNIVR